MTTYSGKDGQIKVNASVFGELRNYSYDANASMQDDSELSDTWDTHIPGAFTANWTGKADAWFYDGDAAQAALVVGASVQMGFYPRGSGSGKPYHSGTASVTKITRTVGRTGPVEISFEFQGNGELAGATV